MPKYENQNDLSNEQAVADFIGEKYNLQMEKLNPVYRLDYAGLRDGNVSSFFEIKCRTFKRAKYETMMINAHKVMSANFLMQAFDRNTNLVVRWTDCIGYIPFNGMGRWNMNIGGRFDRGDPKDRDICVYIPISEFTIL